MTAKDHEKADSQIPHLEEEKKQEETHNRSQLVPIKKPVMCASSAVSVGLQQDDP